LHKQVKRLQERYALYESQLQAQKKETNASHETLQEASLEMEVVLVSEEQSGDFFMFYESR
jgi:zona occludens toxin (predicted ATPase)